MRQTFYKNIRVVLWKKNFRKNTKYSRNKTNFKKSAIFERLYHMQRLYPMQNGQFGSKIKNASNMRETFYKNIRVVPCKKPLEETPNVAEMRLFWKSALLQGYSLCIGYSPCKIVSLGQKLKMPKTCEKPTNKNIRVLCKKPLEKAQNIGEMRQFAKWSVWVKS